MKLWITSLCFLALALANAGMLYYHQARTGFWLPREDEGPWRIGATEVAMIKMRSIEAEKHGYASYEETPPPIRHEIDTTIAKEFPPERLAYTQRYNALYAYVGGPGMWQWPLTCATVILGIALAVRYRKKHLIWVISYGTVAFVLFVDATYRSYFGSLGE